MNRILRKAIGTSAPLLLLVAAPHVWGCGQSSGTMVSLPMPVEVVWRVNALNGAGQMTGYFFPAGATKAHAFLYDGHVVIDLGTLGGEYSHGYVINGVGQVAGESDVSGGETTDAFLWSGGAMADLGTLGGSWSSPMSINDSGQVAGFSLTAGDGGMAGFLYADGLMTSLGALGGDQSYALAINNSGLVVGGASLANGDSHGFVFSGGAMQDLGTLGGNYSAASALNNAGLIVGESTLPDGDCHGFIYSGGVMADVGTLGGPTSSCLSINNSGDVIGSATTAGGETHAFIYTGGAMTDIGTLGGGLSYAGAMNNVGQVVGQATLSDGVSHAFLWEKGRLVDLNTLLPADSGWELWSGDLINDGGRIAGFGVHNGVCQMYILDLAAANSPPVAVAGPEQTRGCHDQVTLDGTQSSDPDGDALTYEWSMSGYVLGTNAMLSGALPLGTHLITLKVADPCGASAEATTVVRVVDSTAPVVQRVSASPNVLSPPNHKPVPVAVSVAVLDDCDAAPVCKILSIRANEATDPGDIQITGNLTASLAASRNPAGGGRIYTITVQATDASGNRSTSTVRVTVPKGNGKG